MRSFLLTLLLVGLLLASSSAADSSDALLVAKKLIDENPVVIFSKSYCPYCRRAKDILTKYAVQYKAFEIDQEANGPEVQAALLQFTGQRTVPNIFINRKHIGGADGLSALDARGELVERLKEAGIKVHAEL